MVHPMSAGKGDKPRPMTPSGRVAYERAMQEIYGFRVKVPPCGPERDALVDRIRKDLLATDDPAFASRLINRILEAQAEEA
jgi:hypothetical protein